ncbi:hypothetical protein [Prescottella agglutinans]|uniref:hypothetical protein n=1 Tax=Prescottella agglutinans TaxID=1644129 RepID=UPI003D991161
MIYPTRRPRTRRPFRPIRGVAALGFGVLLAATVVTGCGSSNNDNSPAPSTTTSVSGAPTSGAEKDISDTFVAFFSAQTPPAQKIALVENSPAFADTINAQAESPLTQGAAATVSKVDLDAPGHATVTYTVLVNGQPVLPDQIGEAVQVDGAWKVSQTTFCELLTLQGNPPPVCGATATTVAPPS